MQIRLNLHFRGLFHKKILDIRNVSVYRFHPNTILLDSYWGMRDPTKRKNELYHMAPNSMCNSGTYIR